MQKKTPTMRPGRGFQDRKRSGNRILPFPKIPRTCRDGLVGFYRRPRPTDELARCLADTVRWEVQVSNELDIPVSKQALLDACDWAERGGVPR